MTRPIPRRIRLPSLGAAAGLALAATVWAAEPAAQQSYASSDDAVAALMAAARSNDKAALRAILGPGGDTLISSGDRYADKAALHRFVESYDAYHALLPLSNERVALEIDNHWQLPIPIVQQGGRWHFDSRDGAQEIIDRRVGSNELAAVRASLAYVDAQNDYFARTRQRTGTGVYAERLVSTPGKHDGLYWPAADGQEDSPLQPLVTQAQEEGYPGQMQNRKLEPYQGYFFRILYSQGPEAPGGAKQYVQNGRMTRGFALIAWPASYAASGIMSFIVNQDGVLFQKDLGPETARIAAGMTQFNADPGWAVVSVTDQ